MSRDPFTTLQKQSLKAPLSTPEQTTVAVNDAPDQVTQKEESLDDVFAFSDEPTTRLGFFQSIAIPLAKRGLKVIPVNGKVAFIPNHPAEATTSVDKITTEWAKYADCNVAIHCLQEPGGTVILDDDGKIDLGALYTFETGEPAPQTRRIVNRPIEDGKPYRSHWIFRQTPETIMLEKNIVEGMTDGEFSFRVKNFYAVGEGSKHPDHGGIYHAITDVPVIPMPKKFLAWLIGRANKNTKTGDYTKKPEGWINDPIVHGNINNGLTAIGGWYVETKNINDGDILASILGRHAEKQAVHKDGVTPYSCNLDEICTIAHGLVKRYKTGEEKKREQSILDGLSVVEVPQDVPTIDDPDEDARLEMTGETFNTKVYEDMAQRFTPYPDPGEGDLISQVAHKCVRGTNIPLAYTREPLKAIVLHALDGKLIHPAYPKMSLRGNYFSLGESEGGKTTGLQFAIDAGEIILKSAGIHPEDLFRYKSETVFIRSFTPEGTIKRDASGAVKSGHAGHASQFLSIKEGNLVANSSDYFASVFSQLTNLYDQTKAGTESMTNGDHTAAVVKASTVMCFTPTDYADTFGGKGVIGGGGLNRWALVNPPENHDYDDKDWERLDDSVITAACYDLNVRVSEICQVAHVKPIILVEEPGAQKIRLEVKSMLKTAGKVGKRVLDYFIREQVSLAATAAAVTDRINMLEGRIVMTTEQAAYAKSWVKAQIDCRLESWPSDSKNQIEGMEHAIRKAVNTHFVSETKLKDVCHFYREGSGGWFVYSTALKNALSSGAIKLTGKTRKNVATFCPGFCAAHAAIEQEEKPKPKKK